MEERLTIIVDSFDGYSDIWPYFFKLLHKYWADCPYKVKLVCNLKDFDEEQIKTGEETDWVTRTLSALNYIDSPYVLLLLEDYFLSENICNRTFEQVFSNAFDLDMNYLRLIEIPKSRANRKGDILPIYANEEYGINLQASIWKVDFLKTKLIEIGKGSAWEFEVFFLKNRILEKKTISGCYTLKGNTFGFHNGVLKGKWFRKEIQFYKKRGVDIDYTERGRLSFLEEKWFVISQKTKRYMPYFMRKAIKRILKAFGFRFVSDI